MFSFSRVRSTTFFFLLFATVFLSSGCARQEAVNLYVDAVMLNELDQQDQAIEKLNTAIQQDSSFTLAYSFLGDIYQNLKDYEKSAVAYEKATELNNWSFKDFFNLGKVYQVMQKFRKAVNAYVRACQLEPQHFQAHLNTAKCFYELKDYPSALEYGQHALQIDPNATQIQAVLGDIYEAQKDHDQAIAAYKRALEVEGNKPKIMINLAIVYLRTGQNNAAKQLLLDTIEIEPKNNTAYQYLGYCLLRLKEIDESINSYARAIEIKSDDWMAHKGLGVAYMLKVLNTDKKELREKAIDHWNTSLDIKPDQPKLRKLLEKYSK